MTVRGHRPGLELAAALTAASFGWAATCSWRGMVADPSRYLAPTIVAALLIAGIGAAGRSLRLRWYAVLGIQLVAVLGWFHHRQNGDGFAGGWIPTPNGLAEVIDQVGDGASAVNTYAAPVGAEFFDAPVYLIACSLLVLVLIDLIACGLRLPAWAGFPALVAVTVPISVLDGGLPVNVYVATGLLFALLLAVLEADRAASWGPVVAETGAAGKPARLPVAALGVPAVMIATAATVLALIVSLGVPVGDGLIREHSGSGAGGGGTGQITLSNPLVDMRRDLVRNDHVPLLDVSTGERDLSYLRLTILDSFTNGSWMPSQRDLSADHSANGDLPNPPGLARAQAETATWWLLQTSKRFETSWLPTPSVTRSIDVRDGDWRYDPDFLDIASADDRPPTEVRYELFASSPKIVAADLDGAAPAPANLVRTMTALPTLPELVPTIAEEITAGGRTDYAKAVLLQNWFRSSGLFTYSLTSAPGDGLEQLARFITTDKVGYCEQYAAAMAVMARAVGIPARVVVGFLKPSERTPSGFRYTSDDLHAWPEIYFAGSGWVRFEPTPSARTGASPAWTRSSVESPAPKPTPGAPTASPSRQASPETVPVPTGTGSEAAAEPEVPVGVLVAGGIAVLVLLLSTPALVRSRQRRRRYGPHSDPRSELEELWRELGATAIDVGAPWSEDRSPRMVAAEISSWASEVPGPAVGNSDRAALDDLVVLIEQARYGAMFASGSGDRDRAAAATHRWSEVIESSLSASQALRARLLPRSVLTRRRAVSPGSAEQTDESSAPVNERV